MEPLDLSDLPQGAVLLLDSAPIIYFLEEHLGGVNYFFL